MDFDGKKQRNALTGAEQALRALAAGQPERATKNADKAAGLDQIGVYSGLPDAVAGAAAELDTGAEISQASWDRLKDVVGVGPLSFLIDELRG